MSLPERTTTLLIFDATRLHHHISSEDDPDLVDLVVEEYGNALQHALSYFSAPINSFMKMHYNDVYYTNAIDEAEFNNLEDRSKRIGFFNRTVDDDGNIVSKKARFDELVDVCIETFNAEIAAYLRGIQLNQGLKIFTIQTLGYENKILRILVTTNAEIIP